MTIINNSKITSHDLLFEFKCFFCKKHLNYYKGELHSTSYKCNNCGEYISVLFDLNLKESGLLFSIFTLSVIYDYNKQEMYIDNLSQPFKPFKPDFSDKKKLFKKYKTYLTFS